MKPADRFEIRGQRFALARLERSHKLVGRLLDGFLDLLCFHFSVLLCGDLVPSLEAGEPKDRAYRRTEKAGQDPLERQPA